jgi:hypothetical protein
MKRAVAPILTALVILGGIAGCVIANPSPYAQGLLQPGYNRAWNNAIDAMKDEGVQVVMADVAGGLLEGRRGENKVTARVVTQANGSIDTSFAASDPDLAHRVQERYRARMTK